MKHDPFCKAYYPDLTEPARCMWCMVISRVREDEREKLDVEYWVGYNKGYLDGYNDAEEHFVEWDMSLNQDGNEKSTNEDKNGGTQ